MMTSEIRKAGAAFNLMRKRILRHLGQRTRCGILRPEALMAIREAGQQCHRLQRGPRRLQPGEQVTAGSILDLFATHPPMEKRIAALQRLEAQLQGTGR